MPEILKPNREITAYCRKCDKGAARLWETEITRFPNLVRMVHLIFCQSCKRKFNLVVEVEPAWFERHLHLYKTNEENDAIRLQQKE